MTERHHQHHSKSSAGATYKPVFEPWKPTSEIACVSSGMVVAERLSEEPITLTANSKDENVHIEEWTGDTSSSSCDSDGCPSEKGALEVAGPNDCVGRFGNIVVKNSSEVQFGNNTYYQGPVVIKQFVYKGAQNGQQLSIGSGSQAKPIFITDADNVESIISDCVKSDKTNFIDNSKNDNIVSDNVRKGNTQWINYVYRHRILFISFSIIFIIIALIVCLSLILRDQKVQVNVSPSNKLKIISRIEWLAQPPARPAVPLQNPVPYVIVLQTDTENCTDPGRCVLIVRYRQTLHIDGNNWWDIADNFLVAGDGLIYEGRGWQSEGADAFGYNSRSIEIAFIGTFDNNVSPTRRQINAAKLLIAEGVHNGYIMADYLLLSQSQLPGMQTTGTLLFEEIQTWPHWFHTCGDLPIEQQLANISNGSQSHTCN